MAVDEYYTRLESLTRDVPSLRKAMLDATYYVRRMLQWRGRMPRWTYDIFIAGLLVSTAAFVITALSK